MRKTLEAFIPADLLAGRRKRKKRLVNDVLYYLRKLMKMARELQKVTLAEGVEIEGFDSEIGSIQEEIEQLEKELEVVD